VVSLAAEFPNDNPALHRGVIWVCLETRGAPVADRDAVPRRIEPAQVDAPETIDAPVEAAVTAPLEAHIQAHAERSSGVVAIAFAGEDDHDDGDGEEPIVVEELEPLGEAEIVAEAAAHVLVAELAADAAAREEEEEEEDAADDSVAAAEPAACAEEEAPATIADAIAPTPSTALPPAPDDPFTVLVCALADVAIAADAQHAAAVLPALLIDGRIDETLAPEVLAALAEGGIAENGAVTEAFATTTRAWRAVLRGTSDDLSACGSAMLDEWAADLLARLLGAPGRAALLQRDLRSRGVAAFGLVEAA